MWHFLSAYLVIIHKVGDFFHYICWSIYQIWWFLSTWMFLLSLAPVSSSLDIFSLFVTISGDFFIKFGHVIRWIWPCVASWQYLVLVEKAGRGMFFLHKQKSNAWLSTHQPAHFKGLVRKVLAGTHAKVGSSAQTQSVILGNDGRGRPGCAGDSFSSCLSSVTPNVTIQKVGTLFRRSPTTSFDKHRISWLTRTLYSWC